MHNSSCTRDTERGSEQYLTKARERSTEMIPSSAQTSHLMSDAWQMHSSTPEPCRAERGGRENKSLLPIKCLPQVLCKLEKITPNLIYRHLAPAHRHTS